MSKHTSPGLLAAVQVAQQRASETREAIRHAHHLACTDDQLAELLLIELIEDAVKLEKRLDRITSALRANL